MKILQVKSKSVVHEANGTKNLRIVMGNRFKKNGYTHVRVGGRTYNASVVSGIVWLDNAIS